MYLTMSRGNCDTTTADLLQKLGEFLPVRSRHRAQPELAHDLLRPLHRERAGQLPVFLFNGRGNLGSRFGRFP